MCNADYKSLRPAAVREDTAIDTQVDYEKNKEDKDEDSGNTYHNDLHICQKCSEKMRY